MVDGHKVLIIKNYAELHACLRCLKNCSMTYENWQSICNIYVAVHLLKKVKKQFHEKTTLSIVTSDLIYCVLKSLATSVLFQTSDNEEEKTVTSSYIPQTFFVYPARSC